MHGLFINGVWETDPAKVKNKVRSYFSNRFKQEMLQRPEMDEVPFAALNETDNNMLCAPFEEETVRRAVWECDGTKYPSPDGFNFNFIKSFWNVLKSDICKL